MGWFLAYDRLSCPRWYALFDAINLKPQVSFPASCKFDWYGDEGLAATTEDAYGGPLKYIRAGDLAAAFKETIGDRGEDSHQLLALHAYFSNLKENTAVVLYWH